MSDLSIKDELERKTLETYDWLITRSAGGQFGDPEVRVALQAMASDTVVIQATVTENGQSYFDRFSIVKVRDGAQGQDGTIGHDGEAGQDGADGSDGAPALSASLTLDSLVLPADAAG